MDSSPAKLLSPRIMILKATIQRTSLNFNKQKSKIITQIDTLQQNHSNYYFLTYVLKSKNIANKDINSIQKQIIAKIKQQDKNIKIIAFTVINKEELKNHYDNIHLHILGFTDKRFYKNKFYVKNNNIKQSKFKEKSEYEIKKASLGIGYILDRHLILGAYNNIQFENFINVNELEDKFKFDKNLYEYKKHKDKRIVRITNMLEILKKDIEKCYKIKNYSKIPRIRKRILKLEAELLSLETKKEVISKSKIKILDFVNSISLLKSVKIGLKQLFKNIQDIWVADRQLLKFGVLTYGIF